MLISSFSARERVGVSDPRDQVFGLLGLLPEGGQRSAIVVDHTKTIEEVYIEATRAIIEHEQTVDFFEYHNVSPSVRKRNLPSWVPSYDEHSLIFYLQSVPECKFLSRRNRLIVAKGDILTVHGYIMDSVSAVTANLSEDNATSCILSQFANASSSNLEFKMSSLWQALIDCNHAEDDQDTYEQGFHDLMSYWTRKNGSNSLTAQGEKYLSRVRQTLLEPDHGMGRPIFETRQGFFGIGPGGPNDSSSTSSLEGDLVALIATAQAPLILRPRNDGSYMLIGTTSLGCIEQTACFKNGNVPILEPLRVM